MKCLLVLVSLIVISAPAYTLAGQDKGNGGDTCENNFKLIRDDIQLWIKNGGSANLKLGKKITPKQYNVQMQKFLSTAQVSCTDKTLRVGKAEKTCKNFFDKGIPRIQCNISRLQNTSVDDQYILVHHEYAGLSELEVNEGEESLYPISNQISHFLEEIIVKKLAIKIEDTLEKKTLDRFLHEANNPNSVIGKRIAQINEENADGRNPDGIISMPVKRNAVQINNLSTEGLNVWRFARNEGALGCTGVMEDSTFLITLASDMAVSGAIYMQKFIFSVNSKQELNAKRKDGNNFESCWEVLDEDGAGINFTALSKIGKFKEIEIKSQTEE